ncbi:hypothetical protein [Lysinibacillus sphaericus]|uniref:hypothetical protein n=1 Tax=Lysinibacillus sphaericus TaxID=1421 RepID=UPI0018CEFC0F|nr:hypothetical protein [Lysinibacillus sphaericus]
MSNGRIKGITVALDGDPTGLTDALKKVNKETSKVTSELKEVERGLKFDPSNTELVAQKQELLANQIQNTSKKLDVLKTAQSQVEEQFRNGDIGAEQYRAFQRELTNTEAQLKSYGQQMTVTVNEQQRLEVAQQKLQTFFQATGTELAHFSDLLGSRLSADITKGTASVDQINRALNMMGKQALGASTDLSKMHNSLQNVNVGGLKQVQQELADVAKSADKAGESVNGFGDNLANVAAGLAAGGGIAGTVQQALDVSSLNTKIDISFDVPEESKASVRDAVKSIEAYGVDGEEALEGVRRQWALNKDASDETNSAIAKGAGVVAQAYSGIDFIELVQEVNEIGAAIEITNEEALALTNALLKAGFPPEQLDTISEYATQMKMVGFNAAEIQSIFERGIETKTWNIDNLNDGVKEAKITMMEFGLEVDKSTSELLAKTDVSAKQFQDWGKAVANGGTEGSQAMAEVATFIDGIGDSALRNELAIKVFGTKWEDQGQNMISVFQGLADAQDKTVQNQEGVNDAFQKMNQDPTVQMRQAFADLQTTLAPLLTTIANLIAQIAQWVSDNVALTAAIVAIVTVIGTLVGAFAALMPAVGGLVTAWPILASAIGAITGPIGIAVLAIAGLGAAFVALWQNSETFRSGVTSVFESIKSVAVTVFETVASFIGEKLAQIKQFWDENGTQIFQAVENVFNAIKAVIEFVMPAIQFVIEAVWDAIKNIIDGALNVIMGAIKVFSGLFTGDFSAMWEGVKQIFSGAIDLIVGWMSLSFFGGLKTIITNLAKTGVNLLKGMWDNIASFFTSMGSKVSSITSSFVSSVVNFFKNLATNAVNSVKSLWTNSVSFFTNLANSAKSIISSMVTTVLNFVKNLATNFVNSISTMKTNVINKMTEIKDGMIEKIKSLPSQFLQIGKDIINGLIKGIGDMFGGVQKKIEALAGLIPEWAKDILGIHSPSRVMREIGLWTGEGLVIGLDESSPRVNKAMEDIGNGILDVSKKYQEEYTNLIDEHNRKNEDKNDKTLEKIYKIQNNAAKKKRALTKQELQEISQLRASYQDQKMKSEIDFQKKYKALVEKSEKEYLEVIKSYIADKKSLDELSLLDEAAVWEQSIEMFVEGSKERILAQKEYQKAVEAVNKEILAINKDYQSQMQKINDDLLKEEERLNKECKTVFDNRVKTLMSYAGTFDAFKVELNRTGQELLDNLQGQVDGFKKWQDEFAKLSGRSIDDGLLKELSDLGVKALPELVALNSMTDEQLTQYSELYREKSQLAREQTEKELVDMRQNTDIQIQELRKVAASQLDKLKTEWSLKIKELTSTTASELSSLQQIGADAGQGLLNGLASMEGPLISKAQQIANAISSTIQQALDIHSPSRVMKGFGVNIGQGLIVGMDEMIHKVAQSSQRLSDAVSNVHGSLASNRAKSQANANSISSSTTTIDNRKTFAPVIHNHGGANDNSRASEKMLKRLAFQLNY